MGAGEDDIGRRAALIAELGVSRHKIKPDQFIAREIDRGIQERAADERSELCIPSIRRAVGANRLIAEELGIAKPWETLHTGNWQEPSRGQVLEIVRGLNIT